MFFKIKLLTTAKVIMLILFSVCLYNLGFAKQYLPLGTEDLDYYNGIPFKQGAELMVERTDSSFIPTDSVYLSGYTATKIHVIVAAAFSTSVPNGVIVGSVKMYYEDGSSDSTDLIMGENIAEWSYDRPENQCCLAHNKITPAFSYLTNLDSESYYYGHRFYVSIETKDSIPLHHLKLSLNESSYTGQPDCPDSCIYYHGLESWFRIHMNSVTLESSSSEVPYDRFDSEFIDLAKWQENDHSVREINNGKLRMNEYGTTRRFSTYLHLTTPVTGYLESKITIQSGSLVLGDGNGFARIGAFIYNSERGPGNYNGYEGNVWGNVLIALENDNSLSAKVSLWKITDPVDQWMAENILDQEFSKSIELDTEYTLSMELSGSQLIFRCDDEEIIYQIQTPVYAPYEPYQHLSTRIYPEEGSAVSVKALFDDVSVVKNVIYDSFDTEFIDLAKWQENDHSVREINNGKLRMNEYGTTRRFSTYLHLTTPVTGYLESKIAVQSGSLVLGDGNGFARIGAYFYNSELGPSNYNAYEGNVWGDVRIVLEDDNTLTAKSTLWKSTAPDQSAGETLLDQEFAKSINFDTEYTLSMELSGSQLIFRCGDEEIIYQIQTPVNAPYDPYQHLATRIYPEEGSVVSVKALFDDVKLEKAVIGDFDSDYDVDGVDLAHYIDDPRDLDFGDFTQNFGGVGPL